MNKYYYKKTKQIKLKKWLRTLSVSLFFFGLTIILYVFSPLAMWQIYFSPVFGEEFAAPIPKTAILNSIDYGNAKNWFTSQDLLVNGQREKPKVSSYTLSIPKIQIKDAFVSTVDMDVGKHLINYQGTSIPGDKGNAVIFGHSTLPQLFNIKDYKTIFATAYQLKIGDSIYAAVNGVSYLYKIYNITVVDPSDTSIFAQSENNFYLTLVTCTPPGTVWKRLIVRARLEKI